MKRRYYKRLVLALLLLGLSISLISCGKKNDNEDSPGAGKRVVAYILPNDGPYYDLKWEGVQQELLDLGYKPERFSSRGYANQREQFDIIERQIARGVAGIILHPVHSRTVCPFVEEAADRGIYVVAENVDIESDRVAGRVMLANYEIGWELAMSLTRLMRGKGKIAALVGPRGQAQAQEMWRAATDYFAKFPEMEIVREEYLAANSVAALETTESILASHPDIDGIYTWYVENAIGAAQALRQSGVEPGRVKVVAKDMNPAGEALLRDDYIQALLVGEPVEMGIRSARLLHDLITGRPNQRNVLLRNFLVTIENVDQIDRTGFEKSDG